MFAILFGTSPRRYLALANKCIQSIIIKKYYFQTNNHILVYSDHLIIYEIILAFKQNNNQFPSNTMNSINSLNRNNGNGQFLKQKQQMQQQIMGKNCFKSTFQINLDQPKGFQNADWDKAIQNVQSRSNRYHKQQSNTLNPDLNYFKKYGPGTFFFFSYLKNLIVLIGLMSLIQLTPIIYNVVAGTNFSAGNSALNVQLARLSVGNHNSENEDNQLLNKLINVIPSMLCLICCVFFYLSWINESENNLLQIQSTVKMISYHCIEVYSFTEGTRISDIQALFSRLNVNVLEIATCKNESQSVYICKQIYDLALDIKEMQLQQQQKEKIEQKQKQMEELKLKLDQFMQTGGGAQTIKFYVVLRDAEARDEIIAQYESFQKSCCCGQPYPQLWLVNGGKIKIRASENQPSSILWQNQDVKWRSRWLRWLLHALILVFVIFVGFCFVFFLTLLVPPFYNITIDVSAYNQITILNQNTSIIQIWCQSNIFLSATSSLIKQFCSSYLSNYYQRFGISVAIGFAVSIFSFILNLIVFRLAKFMRYKTQNEESSRIINNIFFTNIICNLFIIILLQANIFNFSIKDLFGRILRINQWQNSFNQVSQYKDFQKNWYSDVGYQMTIALIINAITPPIFGVLYYQISDCIRRCIARGKKLQRQMERSLQRNQFAVQEYYASVHSLIFLNFILFSGMPIFVPITFIALLFRYFFYKYMFVRHSRIPRVSNELMNNGAQLYFLFSFLLYGLFAIWIFGVDTIFPQNIDILQNEFSSFKAGQGTIGVFLTVTVRKILSTWYFSFLFGLCLLIMLFKCFYSSLAKCCRSNKQILYNEEIKNKMSARNLTSSYKMEQNPFYSEINAILYRTKQVSTL